MHTTTTDHPAPAACPARRGDAIIVHTRDGAFGDRYHVGQVTSITCGGEVTEFAEPGWPRPRRVDHLGHALVQIWVLAQDRWDVEAVMATAAAHTYPETSQVREYDSLDAARRAIAPHRKAT